MRGIAAALFVCAACPSTKSIFLHEPFWLYDSARFDRAEPTDSANLIDELIAREGGYVARAADKGGPTRYGITQATARAHGYAGDMATLPGATAEAIYRADYSAKPGLDSVAALAPKIAAELFDTSVNMAPAPPPVSCAARSTRSTATERLS